MQLTTERFQFLADALHGTGGFADGSYLKRYPREGDSKYNARKDLAWYANPVRRAVSRFVGHIDKRPPIRALENPLMDVISDDCDWRGNSIGVFWNHFMMEAKARGTMLLLIDAPAELPANRAEQEDMRAAPYLVPILPEHVEEYELDHRGLITSVRYADTMDLDGERVDVSRVWDTEGWRVLKGDEVLQSGEPVTIEPPKPKKWEPEGGSYYVMTNGVVDNGLPSTDDTRLFGTEYPTEELAQRASKVMRSHNRLLAYVLEHAPDWEADWSDTNQKKWRIIWNERGDKYQNIFNIRSLFLGTVYMPAEVSRELVDKLNSGEVEL